MSFICAWCAATVQPENMHLNGPVNDSNTVVFCQPCFETNFVVPKPKEKEMSVAANAIEGFKFGCDPEVFILNENGEPVSAEGIIPGSKEHPYPVTNGSVHPDGMAAEFGIDPVDNFADFNRNVASVMKSLEKFLPTGHSIIVAPHVVFSEKVFADAPDKAKDLGCSPDFDAWTGECNPPPRDPNNPLMRTASGHIHIGWGEDLCLGDAQHIMNCRDLVKQLDWYLGAWSVGIDDDPMRRRLYGRAGSFRPKSYGVEYRVLSNFWITTRERRLATWNRLQAAITGMNKRFMPDRAGPKNNDTIIDYINKSSRDPYVESSFRYPIKTLEASYAMF